MNLKQVINNHRQRYRTTEKNRDFLKWLVAKTEKVVNYPQVIARNRPVKSTMELVKEALID